MACLVSLGQREDQDPLELRVLKVMLVRQVLTVKLANQDLPELGSLDSPDPWDPLENLDRLVGMVSRERRVCPVFLVMICLVPRGRRETLGSPASKGPRVCLDFLVPPAGTACLEVKVPREKWV